MVLAIEVLNYVLIIILIGVSVTWIFLIRSMFQTFHKAPYLDDCVQKPNYTPKVSIILPARNEENFITKCIDSLLNQDYSNYEIIAIDDSSNDSTGQIINEYSMKNPKIISVKARPKPNEWMGKNWACMEGYRKATGKLILFTDSDTTHSSNIVSLAVSHLLMLKLDALTVIPKMLCLDKWTRITLPIISTFLHTRFSALRVNDPTKKTGYFFGSFFIIKRQAYEFIGTHEGVKHEIIEDGALGRKVKESGLKLRMVRGEHLVDAIWARDFSGLWNALRRLMVPFYLQNGNIAIGVFFAVLFLFLMPFPILIYSMIFFDMTESFFLLFIVSIISSILIYVGSIIEAKGLFLKISYSLFAPVGCFIVVFGFLSGILHAKSDSAISWRGRIYSMKQHPQSSIHIQ